MNAKSWIGELLAILIAIAVFLAGWHGHATFRPCPEITVGEETTIVVKPIKEAVHDTIYQWKVKYITRKPESDSGAPQRCYSWDKHYENGGYVRCEGCSDSLPNPVPGDFQGRIENLDPPDTLKQISRVDTVRIPVDRKRAWWEHLGSAGWKVGAILMGMIAGKKL